MEQQIPKKSNILRFFPFTKGFRGKFVLAFLMVILAVVANYMTPQVIRVTVDSVINDNPFNLPGFLVDWINAMGGRETLRQHIALCALVSLAFAAIAGLSNYSSRMNLARACEGTVARVRDTLFDHIQRLPYAWHNSHQTGDIIQRCTSGRGPGAQLRQRPADGGGAHRAADFGVFGADVHHERGALPDRVLLSCRWSWPPP